MERLQKDLSPDLPLASVDIAACHIEADPELQVGRQLDLEGRIITRTGPVKASGLVDSGAGAKSFVDDSCVRRNKLHTVALQRPIRLRLADNKRAPDVTHAAKVRLVLDGHKEELWCLVTKLGKFNFILGMPWLEEHNPHIRWSTKKTTFNSEHCRLNCLKHGVPITVHTPKVQGVRPPKPPLAEHDICEVSAYAFLKLAERSNNQVISMLPEHFDMIENPPEPEDCMLSPSIIGMLPHLYGRHSPGCVGLAYTASST